MTNCDLGVDCHTSTRNHGDWVDESVRLSAGL